MQASPGRETGHFLPPCPSLSSTQTPSMATLLYPLGPTHRFPLGARESAGPEFPISGEHQPRSGLARQPTLTPPASAGPKVLSHSLKVRLAHSCRVHTLCIFHELYSPWDSPGQSTGVGSLSLLQGIFPIQGSNPGLPHCRQTLYQLSHQGSPVFPMVTRGLIWPKRNI